MFINNGGVPEQHNPHGGKRHHHPEHHHHHGHSSPQQYGQHHQPYWSWQLTAPRFLLPPEPSHRGSFSPASPLLKFRPFTPPHLPPLSPYPPSTLALLSQRPRG